MTGARRPLRWRILLAQVLVLLAAVATAAVVAALVGPPLFHRHLLEAGHVMTGAPLTHMEQAYASASAVSLLVGLALALLGAVAVTWYLARRLTDPLASLTHTAEALGRGEYAVRVPEQGAGPELDTLARTVNALAERLARTEDTRRRLLTDLAHELRTPLSTIGAYLDGLEDGVVEWDPATARVLRDQTRRLTRLAADLGEVSRAEEHRLGLEPVATRLDGLVSAATDAAHAAYTEKGVDLRAEVRSPAALLDVDPSRIGQVLANLLDNALRHTPTGGRVTVAAEVERGEARVVVVDSGDGLEPEQLEQVFERFYRGGSARDGQGTGIGLTIARGIVEAHGGTLTAASDGPGRGARFTMSLRTA